MVKDSGMGHLRRVVRGLPTLVTALGVVAAPVQASTPYGSFLPSELGSLSSVATVEDASALAINPAAMGFQRSSEIFLSRSLNGNDATHALFTGGGGGSAWQQFRTPQDRFLNQYLFGGAWTPFNGLALGGSFGLMQFLDAQGGNAADLGLSMSYRPSPWFSAGLVVNHLNQAAVGRRIEGTGLGLDVATLKRRYRGGVAIAPGTRRILVSLDAAWEEGAAADTVDVWLGLQGEIIPGLTLRGMADPKGRISLGVGTQFGQLGAGMMAATPTGRIGSSDLMYVTSSDWTAKRSLQLGIPHLAYVRLEGDLGAQGGGLLDLRSLVYPGVLHTTRRIAQAKDDPLITGMILDLRGVTLGVGRLQELREAIAAFRAAGKTTAAYITDPDLGEYYLASACERIILHPGGSLSITGLSTTIPFFKGVLEKLGVQPQFVAIGKYKSAPEQFTRKDLSQTAKEQDQALLADQFEQMVMGIASSRRLSREEVIALINRGIWTPPAAKDKSLIDAIMYPDQVPEYLAKGPAFNYGLDVVKPDTWGEADIVAVVRIDGDITRGEGSDQDLLTGRSAGSATVTRALREIRQDDRIKAVVLRVDSPGGDAVAADEIGRELDLLRLQNKPVIVSMGDVAASGGYWVAANGVRIYAEPGTITGSIGVFTGQFVFKGLLDKLFITTETLNQGAHADYQSGLRPMTDQELDLLREGARYTYGQFLERVAQGRRMSVNRVDQLAQGRVWSGTRALDIGLVDRPGGLETAIQDAMQTAALNPDLTVLQVYPRPGSLLETFDDSTMNTQLKRATQRLETWQRTRTWLLAPSSGGVQ